MLTRRRFLATYSALVVIRVLIAFTSFSFIHPDEYFQNPEVAAAHYFDYSASGDRPLRTWEWQGASPCRSIVPVMGSSGRAFQMLKALLGSSPSATALFAAQRAVMLILSFVIDYALWRASRHSRVSLLLFASSPVAMTFLLRPFSNSLETLTLAAAYLQSSRMDYSTSAKRMVSLGAVLASGVFIRVTFVAFALPLVVGVLLKLADQVSLKPRSLFSLFRLIVMASPAIVGFLAVSLLCTTVDTAFFKTGRTDLSTALSFLVDRRSLVLTPLNLLRYNLSNTNLAEHGLHPRWLHAVVNLPLLFGAGLSVVVVGLADLLRARRMRLPLPARKGLLVHIASFIVPLAFLSLSPHQEPRFLLPLIVPLALLAPLTSLFRSSSGLAVKARKIVWVLWCLHTIAFTVLFGYLHQGGLVPAILFLNGQLRDPSTPIGGAREATVVFWRTFMPPRHLLLPLSPDGSPVPSVRVIDLAGAPFSKVLSTLDNLDETVSTIVLAAPAYAAEARNLTCLPATSSNTVDVTPSGHYAKPTPCLTPLVAGKKSFGVHVDMDRLGDLAHADWQTAGVGLWLVE